MSRAEYLTYLASPEWRGRRQEALQRFGFACALNVRHTGQLEVHHRTYERLGQEEDADVIVLCARCHRKFHDLLPLQYQPQSPSPFTPRQLTLADMN